MRSPVGSWMSQLVFMAGLTCTRSRAKTLNIRGRWHYYSHLRDEDTEALRGDTHLSVVTVN